MHASPPLREIREDSEETLKKIDPKNWKRLRRLNFNEINQTCDLTNDSEKEEEEAEAEEEEKN